MAPALSGHILIVARRDPQDPVQRILKGAGYTLVSVGSAAAAFKAAGRARPGVIVAEARALPPAGRDDLAAFASQHNIPLVLNWGDAESVLSEVEKVLAKTDLPPRETMQLAVGPLYVDLATHVAKVRSRELGLTPKEFDLLAHFARHPDWVWSRRQLLERVWGYDFRDDRVVTVHLGNLRRKIEAAAPGLSLIETIRNVGYKLAVSQVEKPAPINPLTSLAATSPATAGPTDEQRLVTVLVTHITGLAAVASTLDSLRGLMSRLAERLVPCVERYGGGVQRFSTDSVLAVFGAPAAHDNDAELAVRAAFDMISVLSAYQAENQVQGLSAHIGLNTGMVVAGWVEGAAADEYSVIGEAADQAFGLAQLAGPGEILVGPDTLRLAGAAIQAEQVGVTKKRGRPEEVPYFRVRGKLRGQGRDRMTTSPRAALVGREEQLARFRTRLDRLVEGVGGVVFVSGEAGVGKSRLVDEIKHEALTRDIRWLEGRTLSYGQTMSYLPIREILRSDCGIEESDTVAQRERKMSERLEQLFADRAKEFLPTVAALLALPFSGGGDELALPEEISPGVLADSLAHYLGRLGTERPLVIVVEDVHWLDASSLAVLERLIPLTEQTALVLCLAGRREPESGGSRLVEATREHPDVAALDLALPPLSGKQTRRLTRLLLGDNDVDGALLGAVERMSGGNPLFVEEMIRHLLGAGTLARTDSGGWHIAAGVRDLPLPGSLQGIIRARIDQLPWMAQQVLLCASVVGKNFSPTLLAVVAAETVTAALSDSLDCLVDYQLIAVTPRDPEPVYTFKHALVQEAAYDSMLPRRRRELHLRTAQAIESFFSDEAAELYGVLAYHYTRAQDWSRAQDYLLLAGDHSVSLAADSEAVLYYREAMAALLEAFDESFESPESHDRVSWFVGRTEPFWLAHYLGDLLDSALVFHQRVSTACGPADPRTLAATAVLAGSYHQRGMYPEAAALVKSALASLEESGREDDPSLSRLLFILGLVRLNTDRFSDGRALLARALRLEQTRPAAQKGLIQDLYIALISAVYLTGEYEAFWQLAEEALTQFGADRSQRYWTLLLNLCSVNLLLGNWDDAAEQARQCVDGIRNPFMHAVALSNLSEVRHSQGAFLEAEERLLQATAVFEEWGHRASTAAALEQLAETHLQTGKLDKAQAAAERALGLREAASPVNHSGTASAFWTLAGINLARGRLSEAEELLERSAAVGNDTLSPRHPLHAELLFRRAQLRAWQGRAQEAEGDFREATRLIADIGGEEHPRITQMQAHWNRHESRMGR